MKAVDNSLTGEDDYFNLKTIGYFQLMEHEELAHAREASQQSRRYAIAAMAISGLLALVNFF